MNAKHSVLSTAVAALLALSSQADAVGLLGGGAAGAFGGSIARGPISGSAGGSLNGSFAANSGTVDSLESKAGKTQSAVKADAGKAETTAKDSATTVKNDAGTLESDTKGTATQSAEALKNTEVNAAAGAETAAHTAASTTSVSGSMSQVLSAGAATKSAGNFVSASQGARNGESANSTGALKPKMSTDAAAATSAGAAAAPKSADADATLHGAVNAQ